MRVVRWVLLGALVAAALGFLTRMLAPRRVIGGGEVSYHAPTPSYGAEVTVDDAVPLSQPR